MMSEKKEGPGHDSEANKKPKFFENTGTGSDSQEENCNQSPQSPQDLSRSFRISQDFSKSRPTGTTLFKAENYSEIPVPEFLELVSTATETLDDSWQQTGKSSYWEFCRYLVAHPELNALKKTALVKTLRQHTSLDDDDIAMILTELPRVRYAKGAGPLDWALLRAKENPLHDPDGMNWQAYDRFISVAGWLQVLSRDRSFFISVDVWAAKLSVSASTISTWRKIANDQGLILETATHIPHKRATEFRFAVDRYPVLKREFSKGG